MSFQTETGVNVTPDRRTSMKKGPEEGNVTWLGDGERVMRLEADLRGDEKQAERWVCWNRP